MPSPLFCGPACAMRLLALRPLTDGDFAGSVLVLGGGSASRRCCRPAGGPAVQAYGPSMTPTLAPKGDVVLLDMSAPYRWRAARRTGDGTSDVLAVGDVVTLSKPTDRRISIIKRIAGLVRLLRSCFSVVVVVVPFLFVPLCGLWCVSFSRRVAPYDRAHRDCVPGVPVVGRDHHR